MQVFAELCACTACSPPPPHVNGPGHFSSFEGGGPLMREAMFLVSRGRALLTCTWGVH